ncbi:MAG TPA: hypothetical protein VKQ05_12875 [Gemmatimonadales bacterium]|nr:hypothetical protein [Gemmatimonadales bacterium]
MIPSRPGAELERGVLIHGEDFSWTCPGYGQAHDLPIASTQCATHSQWRPPLMYRCKKCHQPVEPGGPLADYHFGCSSLNRGPAPVAETKYARPAPRGEAEYRQTLAHANELHISLGAELERLASCTGNDPHGGTPFVNEKGEVVGRQSPAFRRSLTIIAALEQLAKALGGMER